MGAIGAACSALGSYATGGHFSRLDGVHAHGSTIDMLSDGGNTGVSAISPTNSISGGIDLFGQSFFGISLYGYLAGLNAEASDGRGIINHVALAGVYSAGEFSGKVSLCFFE